MSLSMTYKNKAYPDGETLEVFGVAFENGKSKTLTEQEESRMVQLVGGDPVKHFKDSEQMKVSGSLNVKVSDVVPKDVSDVAGAPAETEGSDT
jgi:hypothetical protein